MRKQRKTKIKKIQKQKRLERKVAQARAERGETAIANVTFVEPKRSLWRRLIDKIMGIIKVSIK